MTDPQPLTAEEDQPGIYAPSPEMIREVSKQIRKTWSKGVKNRRKSNGAPVETLFVDLFAHNRGWKK